MVKFFRGFVVFVGVVLVGVAGYLVWKQGEPEPFPRTYSQNEVCVTPIDTRADWQLWVVDTSVNAAAGGFASSPVDGKGMLCTSSIPLVAGHIYKINGAVDHDRDGKVGDVYLYMNDKNNVKTVLMGGEDVTERVSNVSWGDGSDGMITWQ
jgi:hypothetical protein